MYRENLSDEEYDLRIAQYYQQQEEVFERMQVSLEEWHVLEKEYRAVRQRIGIDEITYFELLEYLYQLRQELGI